MDVRLFLPRSGHLGDCPAKKWSRFGGVDGMNPRSSTVGFRIHVRAPLQPRHVHELHHVEHLRAAVAAVARESDSLVPSGGLVPSRRHHPHRVELRHRRRGRRRSAGGGNRSGRLQCVHGRAIYLDRAIVHDERRRGVIARVVCRARRGLRPSLLRALRPALDPVRAPSPASAAAFFRLSLFVLRISRRAELYACNASLHVCLSPSKSAMGWKLEHLWQKRTSAPPLTTWRAPMCSRHVWYRLQ